MTSTVHPPSPESLRDLAGARAGPIEAATLALVCLAQLAGESVGLEDLVLHAERLDARAPSLGTVMAARLLRERRSLAARAPAAVLAGQAVRRLAGLLRDAPGEGVSATNPDALLFSPGPAAPARVGEGDDADDRAGDDGDGDADAGADAGLGESEVDLAAIDRLLARTREPLRTGVRRREPGDGAAARIDLWLATLEATAASPGALAAAVALDAWLSLEPAERRGEAGWLLAATVLRQRGLARHHLPALALAYRKGRFRWSPHLAQERRIAGLLDTIAESARLADADLKRLALARELMMQRCRGRRDNARLPELIGLFVASPVVTTQLAARRLRVTPQAVEAMLKQLGPSLPRELTGRKRYRAWGIV